MSARASYELRALALTVSKRTAYASRPNSRICPYLCRAAFRTGQPRLQEPQLQTSNLPPSLKDSIAQAATLPNPDPAADSPSARLVSEQAPYMVATYARPPPIFTQGEGCYLFDIENRRYLDFTAGIAVNSLGHADPQLIQIISNQAATLIHSSNLYHNPWTGLLSQTLVEATVASGGMCTAARAFICNSGSEANEAAIKFARKTGHNKDSSGKKHKIVSFRNAFHGRTFGSLSATPNPKYQAPFAPMVPGFVVGEYNDVDGVERLIDGDTCGVIVEPIQGEGGVNVATSEFLRALRKRCNDVGALLIYDEIQCGLGRTGDFWAHTSILGASEDSAAAHPDILTTAKALGNGYPIGAVIVTEDVANHIVTGDHGTTFGGNPMGARIAHNIIGRLSQSAFLAEVTRKSSILDEHVRGLEAKFPDQVRELRGQGLIRGIQLEKDAAKVVTAARERGLLIITCGVETLRLVPPLVISDSEIEQGMEVLNAAMDAVFSPKT